jgi:hypothetical protein
MLCGPQCQSGRVRVSWPPTGLDPQTVQHIACRYTDWAILAHWDINRLTPDDPYMGLTAPLTSKRCILYVYSTNIGTEYFKHALYSPFFSFQNAVCFIMLTCLVPILFTFYTQDVIKKKKNNNNSNAKGLMALCKTFHSILWEVDVIQAAEWIPLLDRETEDILPLSK